MTESVLWGRKIEVHIFVYMFTICSFNLAMDIRIAGLCRKLNASILDQENIFDEKVG